MPTITLLKLELFYTLFASVSLYLTMSNLLNFLCYYFGSTNTFREGTFRGLHIVSLQQIVQKGPRGHQKVALNVAQGTTKIKKGRQNVQNVLLVQPLKKMAQGISYSAKVRKKSFKNFFKSNFCSSILGKPKTQHRSKSALLTGIISSTFLYSVYDHRSSMFN